MAVKGLEIHLQTCMMSISNNRSAIRARAGAGARVMAVQLDRAIPRGRDRDRDSAGIWDIASISALRSHESINQSINQSIDASFVIIHSFIHWAASSYVQ